VHGDRDALVPLENARLLAARIPDAEVAIVPGAGHAYLLERPEEAHRLLVDWLDRRGPIAPGPARTGLAARAEPWSERLGLPLGLVRTTRDRGGVLRLRARRRRARADAARRGQRIG
jgi:hypothetical protein